MANAHRNNVLVTSCLKTPVDPHTKAPLALYERERAVPYSAAALMDNRDYEKEMEYDDSGSEFGDGDAPGKGRDYHVAGDHIDLRDFYFSNEEYYRKLEELKKAHLRTMAELEDMYRKKLQLKGMPPQGNQEGSHRLSWVKNSPGALRRLRKSCSALELRRGSGLSDTSDEDEEGGASDNYDTEKGLLSSPKEHIKNMWQDFKLSPRHRDRDRDRFPSSSSLHSLPGATKAVTGRGKGRKQGRGGREAEPGPEAWRSRMTVPRPFHMTVREAEKRRRGVKTRSEVELENEALRRQVEELTECQRKFRASPAPAHVRLPLYEELRERDGERRRAARERQQQRLHSAQQPFSFLERERLKREQREEQLRHLRPPGGGGDQAGAGVRPFKAKPVPQAVYDAASGEQMKEEQLYRAIKMQMRARDLLHSASMPPSMLAPRLSERRRAKEEGRKDAGGSEDDDNASPHRPRINPEVPDFDASYRRFQRRAESRRDVKPVTACEPFQLRTSQIASHRDRVLADIQREQASPRGVQRWPYVSPGPVRRGGGGTPGSSLCSSLSGSMELLPAKVTDTAKKRQEAVRKLLEQRRKVEEEEERWRERQKQREKKLQKVVSKRAQANDPHLALSQTNQNKLKQFRKQDLQRRKEYKIEMKEIQQRVKGRPLLLEQVAQRNAQQAAEKRYTDTLRGCGLSEEFISSRAPQAPPPDSRGSFSTDSKQSEKESDTPVAYSNVYLDDHHQQSVDPEAEAEQRKGAQKGQSGSKKEEEADRDRDEDDLSDPKGTDYGSFLDDDDDDADNDDDDGSDDGYQYSEDDDQYSEDSEHGLPQGDRNEGSDIIKGREGSHSGLSHKSSQHSPNSHNAESDGEKKIKSDHKSDEEV